MSLSSRCPDFFLIFVVCLRWGTMKLAELIGIARPLEVARHGLVQCLAVPPGPLGRKLSPQSKSSVMPRKTPKLSAARTRIVSAAAIRLDHRKSARPFKGKFCHDISEFECRHSGAAMIMAGPADTNDKAA